MDVIRKTVCLLKWKGMLILIALGLPVSVGKEGKS